MLLSARTSQGLKSAPKVTTKVTTKLQTVSWKAPSPTVRPSSRVVVAAALLLPQEHQEVLSPLEQILHMMLRLVEGQQEITTDTQDVPEVSDDEGHVGWGHSHIADRLATEPASRTMQSRSTTFDL